MENIMTCIQLASDLAALAAAVASLADVALRHKRNPSNEPGPGQSLPHPGGTTNERSSGDDEAE